MAWTNQSAGAELQLEQMLVFFFFFFLEETSFSDWRLIKPLKYLSAPIWGRRFLTGSGNRGGGGQGGLIRAAISQRRIDSRLQRRSHWPNNEAEAGGPQPPPPQ